MVQRQIAISERDRRSIASALGVSSMAMTRALRYETNSDTSQRIRQIAKEHGGVVQVIAQEDKVLLDDGNIIRQTYSNGVTLELEKLTGDIRVLRDKNLLSVHRNVTLSELNAIQKMAIEM